MVNFRHRGFDTVCGIFSSDSSEPLVLNNFRDVYIRH